MIKSQPIHIINKQLASLLEGESNIIANLSNASALLNDSFDNINWAGFYLWNESDRELVLGPFQGKVACVRIPSGKGVCGTAFAKQETIVVPDVHQFPGHIACDSASQSEIVVPLKSKDRCIGVLDIDSPIKSRFTEMDQTILEEFVGILMKNI